MLSYTMGEDGFLMRKYFDRIHFTSFQIIIMGFSLVILIGSLLLMLPFARAGAGCASFGEALFTATSAVCVTGLVVQDTATYWSGFGQAVILALIQIGGMGVVTAAVVGYLCIRLLKFIAEKGRFGAFAYYCWAVGVLTLVLQGIK